MICKYGERFIKIFWLFILPFIFTYTIFNPLKTYPLNTNTDTPQTIVLADINEDLTSFVLADFFQTSLSLGWYNICLDNNTTLPYDDSIIKIVDPSERGAISVSIRTDSLGKQTLKARPFEEDCKNISPRDNMIDLGQIGTTTINDGAMRDTSKLTYDEVLKMLQSVKIKLYIKENLWAFLIKYIILLALWIHLSFLALKTGDFIIK